MIYLRHKDHGNHIVYSEDEAKACEKAGWKRAPSPGATPSEPAKPAPVTTEEQDWLGAAPDIPKEVLPKRRGRQKSTD